MKVNRTLDKNRSGAGNKDILSFNANGGLNTVDVHSMSSDFFLQARNVSRLEQSVLSKRLGHERAVSGLTVDPCEGFDESKQKIVAYYPFNPSTYYQYELNKDYIDEIFKLTPAPVFYDKVYDIFLTKVVDKHTNESQFILHTTNSEKMKINFTHNDTKYQLDYLTSYEGKTNPLVYTDKLIIPIGDVRKQISQRLSVPISELDFLPLLALVPIYDETTQAFSVEGYIVKGRSISAAEHNNTRLGANVALAKPNETVTNVDGLAVVATSGIIYQGLSTPKIGDVIDFHHIYSKPTTTTLKIAWSIASPDDTYLWNDYDDVGKVVTWHDWDENQEFKLLDVINSKFAMEGSYRITSTIIDAAQLTEPPNEYETGFYLTAQSEIVIDSEIRSRSYSNNDIWGCTGLSLDTNINQLILFGGPIHRQRIYYLNVNDIEYSPLYQFLEVSSSNVDVIQNTMCLNQDLIIFGENNIHQFNGSSIRVISNTFGLLAPKTAIDVGYGVQFLSGEGVKLMTPANDMNTNYKITNFGREVANKVSSLINKDAIAYLVGNEYCLCFPSSPVNDYKSYGESSIILSNTWHVYRWNTVSRQWLMDASTIFKDMCYAGLHGGNFLIACNNNVYKKSKTLYTDDGFVYDVVIQPSVFNSDNENFSKMPYMLYLRLFSKLGDNVALSVDVFSENGSIVKTEEYSIVEMEENGIKTIKSSINKISNIELLSKSVYGSAVYDQSHWDLEYTLYNYPINLWKPNNNSNYISFVIRYVGDSDLGFCGGMFEVRINRISNANKKTKIKTRW